MNNLNIIKSSPFIPKVIALALVALTIASACGWLNLYHLDAESTRSVNTLDITQSPVNSDYVKRALGGSDDVISQQVSSEPLPELPKFNLVGLAGNSSVGAGLIALDGGSPKLIKLGQEVANGWILKSIEKRHVVLFKDGDELQVDLPSLKRP